MDFNAIFTVRFKIERYMWWYEFYPPHLINVATLPCENQNTDNVVLQQDITKENCIKCILASLKWTRVIYLIFTYFSINLLLLMSSVTSLIVHLMKTWSNFEQNVIDAATDQ